mgnify:CR=1 FL=1
MIVVSGKAMWDLPKDRIVMYINENSRNKYISISKSLNARLYTSINNIGFILFDGVVRSNIIMYPSC